MQESACLQPLIQSFSIGKWILHISKDVLFFIAQLDVFRLDMPCCTQYQDDVWYRCLISDIKLMTDDDFLVTIYYVDYGNYSDIKVNWRK